MIVAASSLAPRTLGDSLDLPWDRVRPRAYCVVREEERETDLGRRSSRVPGRGYCMGRNAAGAAPRGPRPVCRGHRVRSSPQAVRRAAARRVLQPGLARDRRHHLPAVRRIARSRRCEGRPGVRSHRGAWPSSPGASRSSGHSTVRSAWSPTAPGSAASWSGASPTSCRCRPACCRPWAAEIPRSRGRSASECRSSTSMTPPVQGATDRVPGLR